MVLEASVIEPGWDAAVPDMARWAEVRSILLSGEARLVGTPEGGFVVDGDGAYVGMVGRPGAAERDEMLAVVRPEAELLVVPDGVDHVRALLPAHPPLRAILHRRLNPSASIPDTDVVVAEVDDDLLATMPRQLAEEARDAFVVALAKVEAAVVSVCGAYSITETLWDVGVDTLPEYRRQGHSRRAFLALDAHMTARGFDAIWGALDDNVASLGMARSLGFQPVDELWIVVL